MVTPSDLKGDAVGEASARTRALLDGAKGKVVFIDEAYNLDPARGSGNYGAEVVDTLLEKVEANVGSDMAVILAGYRPQMEQLFRNVKNPGLKRRFNLGEAFNFEDFSNEDIKKVLKDQIVKAGFTVAPTTLDYAVRVIDKKRMEDGFGNAGEAEQILGRAKLRLSARLSGPNKPEKKFVNLLVESDFEGEPTSAENAVKAFGDLEFMDGILAVVDEFKGAVETAMEEGRSPQEVIANMHMIFHGPPGTGKTTCAKRFAVMFKELGLLPRGDIEYTTPSNLIDRYVGGTGKNTYEAMVRAKGGVLFIDEAYGMMPSRGNLFGKDIIQCLLDNVTTEEFKGKLIVILGGYEADINELFSVNPGFQSRFDKKRIEFKEWTSVQATTAVCNAINRSGKTIVKEASAAMEGYFHILSDLPNWASARDAMEVIYVQIENKRAYRSSQLAKERREKLAAASGGEAVAAKPAFGRVGATTQADGAALVPYELVDVRSVFEGVIRSRGGDINAGPSKKGKVRKIVNDMGLKDAMARAKKEAKPFILYFHSSSCSHCSALEPEFMDLADECGEDVVFGICDDESGDTVFRSQKVDSVPRTRIYVNGTMSEEIRGANLDRVRDGVGKALSAVAFGGVGSAVPNKQKEAEQQKLNRDYMQEKMKSATMSFLEQPKQKVKENVKIFDASDSDTEKDEDVSDEDIQAALEEAFNKLGYTLDQIKDALESSSFPPDDVVKLILEQFLSSGRRVPRGKIDAALNKQKDPLLSKIKQLIKERSRLKTETEIKVQEALKHIGKCCMGFDWLKINDGYQCAGGSHFCSDAEIDQWQLKNGGN